MLRVRPIQLLERRGLCRLRRLQMPPQISVCATQWKTRPQLFRTNFKPHFAPQLRCLSSGAELQEHPVQGAAAPVPYDAFDRVLEDIAEMPVDTNRLERVTLLINDCRKKEDWINLMKLGLFLLSSPEMFCHHSCLLAAAALSASPHAQEAMGYMQELAARGVEPNASCVVRVANALVKEGKYLALANGVISLSHHNVFVYPDILDYAFLVFLQKDAYAEAYALLDIIEAKSESSYLKGAYENLFFFAPDEAMDRYSRLRALGLYRQPAFASRLLALGQAREAADALYDNLRTVGPVSHASELFKRIVVELMKDPREGPLQHGSWNGAEKMAWAIIRSQGCNHASFEEAMRFWSYVVSEDKVNSAAAEEAASDGLPRAPALAELRETCLRRRREVLFDMCRAGVPPKVANFKMTLQFDPSVATAAEALQHISDNGELRSLAGLWAAVMLAAEIRPSPPLPLMASIIKSNLQEVLADTNRLLSNRGHRAFIPRARRAGETGPGDAAAELRFDVDRIEDGVVQFAWAQMLSELYAAAEETGKPMDVIADVLGEEFRCRQTLFNTWLFRAEIRGMLQGRRWRERARLSQEGPEWAMRRALRVHANPLVLAESLNMVLAHYAAAGKTENFFQMADFMVENRYLDRTGLEQIRSQCVKRGRVEMYHEVVVELARGLCGANNKYGAELIADFESELPEFSCKDLHQRWKDVMNSGICTFDFNLSDPFQETLAFYAQQLRPEDGACELPWAKRSQIIDNMAAIVITQKTCGFMSDWKVLDSVFPSVLLTKSSGALDPAYLNKMVKFGTLAISHENVGRRLAYRYLLSHFSNLDADAFERIWDVEPQFCVVYVAKIEHLSKIIKSKCRQNAFPEVVEIIDSTLTKRGDLFAAERLAFSPIFSSYMHAHLATIYEAIKNGGAAGPDIVAAEMARYERIVAKIDALRLITKPILLTWLLNAVAVDKMTPKTPVEHIWTIFIYVEKLVEALEHLPPHSVPVPTDGGAAKAIAEIIGALNKSMPKLSPKRASSRSAKMHSIYPSSHLSGRDRHQMILELKYVVDKISWLVSPKHEDLYQRLVTCKSRLHNLP